MPRPGEDDRPVREEDRAEREKGEDNPKDLDREVPRAGWRRGDMEGLWTGCRVGQYCLSIIPSPAARPLDPARPRARPRI